VTLPRASASTLSAFGRDLLRPESVIARADGALFVSDARGGVVLIHPDGAQESWVARPDPAYAGATGPLRFVTGDVVNGLALLDDGRVLAANIGRARIEAIGRGGARQTIFSDIDGRPLRFVNHVCPDANGALWVTVMADPSGRPQSGFIAVSLQGEPLRVAAEGLNAPNECRVDTSGNYLLVAETGARRISRFPILGGAHLGARATFGPNDLGGFPDGIRFDGAGALWGVLIGRDVVFWIDATGRCERVFAGGDQAWFDAYDEALARGILTLEDAAQYGFAQAPLLSSLEFHAPSRSLVAGSLCGSSLPSFACDVQGAPNVAWHHTYVESALSAEQCLR